MTHKSKYISEKFPIPGGWTSEEFWWAVEQLEKYGDENNLFNLAWDLGIKFDLGLKGRVKIVDLMIVILNEGGTKNKIMDAIKNLGGGKNND